MTWGTNPGMVAPVTGSVPEVGSLQEIERRATELALHYMGLEPGKRIEDIGIDRVFIGSCTNSRLEDLRAAARVAKGHHVSTKVRAMVVPGSQTVKRAAEQEGLHRIFLDAGFEWRESGCSMCPVSYTHLFRTEDFVRLKNTYGVGWAVVEQPGVAGLDCAYQNSVVRVCRIP